MTDMVLETAPLGTQWPTIDPFLFCAHHDDMYPPGNGQNGPAASLAGRPIGQDFGGIDGWNMYHGSAVPGFPQHPHRGFETVSFGRHGLVDHADSLGASARFGRGDVQWMTAGSGVVHSEMFPLVDESNPNHLQFFQIWLNLPASDKMVAPYFTMMWDAHIPKIRVDDEAGHTTVITVIAGAIEDAVGLDPPPNSWASRAEADVGIWHLHMEPGASWELPAAAQPTTQRMLYLFEGDSLDIGGQSISASTGALLRSDEAVRLTADTADTEIMVLQGSPIGENVAQYGPFVMNSQQELRQTFDDYQRTGFGGWPWPDPDPVHSQATARFALHADGTHEDAPTA